MNEIKKKDYAGQVKLKECQRTEEQKLYTGKSQKAEHGLTM